MTYDRNTVHMLWIGGDLSTLERVCLSSFVKNGHTTVLHTYGKVGNVPGGVIVSDANEILSESHVFSNTGDGIGNGGFAGFSDWFRYELLGTHPGWWCDTDMVCLRRFDFDQNCVVATSRERQWGTLALGCALRLDPDDPLLNFCMDFCRNNNVKELVSQSYIAVGPGLLQRGIRELGLQHYEVPPDTFCSISWRHSRFLTSSPVDRVIYNIKRRIRGGEPIERIKSSSKGLHLWHSTWKLGGIEKDSRHHQSSIFEKLKRQYLD